jgi:hypothetical protein
VDAINSGGHGDDAAEGGDGVQERGVQGSGPAAAAVRKSGSAA